MKQVQASGYETLFIKGAAYDFKDLKFNKHHSRGIVYKGRLNELGVHYFVFEDAKGAEVFFDTDFMSAADWQIFEN